jgi:hypothetical protein
MVSLVIKINKSNKKFDVAREITWNIGKNIYLLW